MIEQARKKKKVICTMTSFSNQNPSGFCYLVQIRAFDLAGIFQKNLYERKKKPKGFWTCSKITPPCKCIAFGDK